MIVTLPYILFISHQQKTIAQYYFTHTFYSYFIRTLGFWMDNSTLRNNIRLADANTLAVLTTPDS